MRTPIPFFIPLAIVLLSSGVARAFCQSTTAPTPANYDPSQDGCITAGAPLSWHSMPVTYELNQAGSVQVSVAEASSIMDAAFAEWANVSCPATSTSPAGHPSLSIDRLAPTDAGFQHCPEDAEACERAQGEGPHEIVFRDEGWPYGSTNAADEIALTTVAFGAEKGDLKSANIEVNSHDHTFSLVSPPPFQEDSLSAVLRHEAGHFLGLAHSNEPTAAMYAYYSPQMTSLTQDDMNAICAVYPPAYPSGCGCSTVGFEGQSRVALVAMLLAAFAARRSRRRGRGHLSAPS